MILKQRFKEGKTQFIDIGDDFVITTPANSEWSASSDVHSVLSYCDKTGRQQDEPLFKEFLQWIYSNNGHLFLTLTSPEWHAKNERA